MRHSTHKRFCVCILQIDFRCTLGFCGVYLESQAVPSWSQFLFGFVLCFLLFVQK